MNKSIKHLGWSVAFLLVLLCCGCFQAENPFYRESDIVTDKRFEGRFVSATTNSNSTLSDSFVVKLAKNRHYTIRYREGDKWAELDVVLFKCGTNLFLDLKKVADNGVNSEPAVGPSSGMEILHIATMFDAHCVLRVRFIDDGIESSGALHGNPLYAVLKRHSNLKYKTSYKGEPIDPHIRIITNRTEELHALLLAEGSKDEVFGVNGTTFKRKE
jgi:hypothetical protein